MIKDIGLFRFREGQGFDTADIFRLIGPRAVGGKDNMIRAVPAAEADKGIVLKLPEARQERFMPRISRDGAEGERGVEPDRRAGKLPLHLIPVAPAAHVRDDEPGRADLFDDTEDHGDGGVIMPREADILTAVGDDDHIFFGSGGDQAQHGGGIQILPLKGRVDLDAADAVGAKKAQF